MAACLPSAPASAPPGVVDVRAAAEVPVDLHEPFRRLLPTVPARALPDGLAEEAVGHWRDKSDEFEFASWLRDGRHADRPQVNEQGFYTCSEVAVLRGRVRLADWREEVRAAGRRAALFGPLPPHSTLDVVPDDPAALLDYGRDFKAAMVAAGHDVSASTDAELTRYGRSRWEAWGRVMRRCPFPWVVYREARNRIVPHARFWWLVADTRPVVISARTGRLIDGLRRLRAHVVAGDRSPGVPVVWLDYADDAAEREAVVRLNAANPALPSLGRVRLAEYLRPAYRRQAAANSGRRGGEFTDLSGTLRQVGRLGAKLKRKDGGAVRVNERLADVAGLSRKTYELYRRRLREGDAPAPAVPVAP